ncbi:MAG TPA: response regulator [Thermoanaerobaculia bacterium]|nr:response regulator [Thermoanaerobaculia bacterium]
MSLVDRYLRAIGEHDAELRALTVEAAHVCGAPVALLGFLDGDRERVKVSFGWNVEELPLVSSFAARFADARDVVVLPDASTAAGFAEHPFVAGAPNVRFIASVPLMDPSGAFIGALTVLDRSVHHLQPLHAQMLRLTGRQIVQVLQARTHREEVTNLRESLDESEARFRDLFEQTDDLIMSIGIDGRVLHANQATLNALGATNEELSRIDVVRIVDSEERESFRRALQRVFVKAEPQRVETVFMAVGNRRITVEGALRPRIIDGRAVMARVVFRDVTDRKHFETDLANARDAALEAARLKTRFLTNVSHEIRTPMNGIIGMIDLLLGSRLSEEQADFAHQGMASAEQLLSIVNNVLYVSSVESGGLSTANADFDLYRLLERVVEVMKVGALGKDVDIRYSYDESLPTVVYGNQGRIRQIVTNLMDNAVKFTMQGSVSLRVTRQTDTATHDVVRFEVRDTGIGIAEEDRLLLFERFSQIEGSSTRRFQGIGLGLAAARQLVEMMGGVIDAESSPGIGSTFWFSIPFARHEDDRKPIVSSDLDFKGKRVLLVDQTPTSRRVLRHYLADRWDMLVETNETAADALTLLKLAARTPEAFDIAIYDAMPDLDPVAFTKRVRADPALASLRLVHLVSQTVTEREMRDAGVNAIVAKPPGPGELFDALTIALAPEALTLARSALAQPVRGDAPLPVVTAEMRERVRVLLAEDNFLNRKLTLSQLEKLGYRVDSVANGKEAVEAVVHERYDVILMDCQMPIVDGYEATLEIRKIERNGAPKHRIIAMTANALEGDREKCLASGMDDYLSKPTKAEDLESALARHFVA